MAKQKKLKVTVKSLKLVAKVEFREEFQKKKKKSNLQVNIVIQCFLLSVSNLIRFFFIPSSIIHINCFMFQSLKCLIYQVCCVMLPTEIMSEVIDSFHCGETPRLKHAGGLRGCSRLHYIPYQTGTSMAEARKDKKTNIK